MSTFFRLTINLTAITGLVLLTLATSANAQITHDTTNHAYFVTGNATINTNITNSDVFVGKDDATNFTTIPSGVTLTVATGANMLFWGNFYPVGGSNPVGYKGLNVFGANKTNITGGNVYRAQGYDTSRINISGGSVFTTLGYGTSTINVTGGSARHITGFDSSTVKISGGSLSDISGFNSSIFDITGGTIANTIFLLNNSIVNVYGTGFSLSSGVSGSDDNGSFIDYILSGTLQNGQSVNGVTVRDYNDGGLDVGNPNAGTGSLRFFAPSVAAPEPDTLVFLWFGFIGLISHRFKRVRKSVNGRAYGKILLLLSGAISITTSATTFKPGPIELSA